MFDEKTEQLVLAAEERLLKRVERRLRRVGQGRARGTLKRAYARAADAIRGVRVHSSGLTPRRS